METLLDGFLYPIAWACKLEGPRITPPNIQVPNPDRFQGGIWPWGRFQTGPNWGEYYLLYLSGHLKGRYGWLYRYRTQD